MPWPDAVEAVTSFLEPLVDPVRVVCRVPQDAATREPLVQVRRVGGPSEPPVREIARLDVWTWAPTDTAAMALALQVRAGLWAMPGTELPGVRVYRVTEFLGPQQADDPSSLTPRVWATYDVTLRADGAIHAAA